MKARRGDFQGALCFVLTLYIGEIRLRCAGRGFFVVLRLHRLHKLLSGKVLYHLVYRLGGVNLYSLHHGALWGVALRDKNFVYAKALCLQHHGQNTRHGLDGSLKGKLAYKGAALAVRFDLAVGAKYSYENGQIIKGACLFYIAGSEVHHYFAHREHKTAVENGGVNSVSGFLYGGIRQTHYIKAGERVGKIHFYRNLVCVYTQNAHSRAGTKHTSPSPAFVYTLSIYYITFQCQITSV